MTFWLMNDKKKRSLLWATRRIKKRRTVYFWPSGCMTTGSVNTRSSLYCYAILLVGSNKLCRNGGNHVWQLWCERYPPWIEEQESTNIWRPPDGWWAPIASSLPMLPVPLGELTLPLLPRGTLSPLAVVPCQPWGNHNSNVDEPIDVIRIWLVLAIKSDTQEGCHY